MNYKTPLIIAVATLFAALSSISALARIEGLATMWAVMGAAFLAAILFLGRSQKESNE